MPKKTKTKTKTKRKLPRLPRVPRTRAGKVADGMGIVSAGIGIVVGLWNAAKLARK